MASEWVSYKIEDCMDAIIDYRGKTPKKVPAGVPLITAKIIKDGRILPTEEYIAEKDYESWMRRGIPQSGDVVVTTEAPLGEIAQLGSEKVALAQRVITLRGKKELLDNCFLKYLMLSHSTQTRLKARASGTTVQGIKQRELRKVELTFPPIHIQRSIARILGTLDDKIELNRRMNKTLEGMAAAVFKSWFIDFDPVRAKSEGRDTNLPAEIGALFPDSFEDSELGPIPIGWTVAPMKDLADVNASSIKKDYPHAKMQYVDISSVSQGSLDQTTIYDLADAPSRAKRLVQTGDTIWSCVRPNRKAYLYIDQPSDNLIVSTGFAVLSPFAVPASYLHQWVTTQAFVDYLTTYATGAAYPAVKADTFETAKLIQPDDGVLKAFHDLVGPLRARIAHNQRQNRRLAGLRDTLLPKLLSGELDISTAESIVEENE